MISLTTIGERNGLPPAFSDLAGLRVYHLDRQVNADRRFPVSATVFTAGECGLRPGDLVVQHTEGGPVLLRADPSSGVGSEGAAGEKDLEVVIFWHHQFDEPGQPAPSNIASKSFSPGSSGPQQIVHIDLDAFFVAVECLSNPSLRGKAVVVGGSPRGRGVVASASYPARQFGVRSAMSVAQAISLCPGLIVVPAHPDRYLAASREVMRTLRAYSPAVEPVSIDEAFLDLTGTERLLGTAVEVCQRLRREIKANLRLDASLGLATNKLVAKIASDLAKPNGLIEVLAGREAEFLSPLAVSRLPGVGRVTNAQLREHGVRLIGELPRLNDYQLQLLFGRYGARMRVRASGRDNSPVEARDTVKSIGHEKTFAVDTRDMRFLAGELYRLVEHAGRGMRELGCMARTVHLKLRFSDFLTVVREMTLAEPTDLDPEIFASAQKLLMKLISERERPVRLIGVRLMQLGSGFGQFSLFNEADERARRRSIVRALDEIRARHGYESILTGRVARVRPRVERTSDGRGDET